MVNYNNPVDTDNILLKSGDYVHSVTSIGEYVEGGRIFYTGSHPEGVFESDDAIDYAADCAVESGQTSAIDYAHWESQPRIPSLHVVVGEGGSFSVFKAYCSVCQMFVKHEGHTLRCRVPGSQHVLSDKYRRLSWVGDALHAADVRYVLLSRGTETSRLDIEAQKYTPAVAQAAYLRTSPDRIVEMAFRPLGGSDRQYSTAFEASYSGSFRDSYVRSELGSDFVPDWSGVAVGTLEPYARV